MVNLPSSMYDYRREQPIAKPVDKCRDCLKDIYEGEEYYNINGYIRCEDCMEQFKKVGGEE